jgi:hypothetical protein
MRNRDDVVFLSRAGKEVIAGTELDTADAHGASKDDNFLAAFVGVAGKPGSLGQSHNRRATSSFVVSKEATFDARVVSSLPLAISSFLHEHEQPPVN